MENAAFNGFSERPISCAIAAEINGSMPNPPSSAAAAALDAVTLRTNDRRVSGETPTLSPISVSLIDFAGHSSPTAAADFAVMGVGWQAVG